MKLYFTEWILGSARLFAVKLCFTEWILGSAPLFAVKLRFTGLHQNYFAAPPPAAKPQSNLVDAGKA